MKIEEKYDEIMEQVLLKKTFTLLTLSRQDVMNASDLTKEEACNISDEIMDDLTKEIKELINENYSEEIKRQIKRTL